MSKPSFSTSLMYSYIQIYRGDSSQSWMTSTNRSCSQRMLRRSSGERIKTPLYGSSVLAEWSRRAGEPLVLQKLNAVLGSGFNLGVARALRSRVALFVEGEDMKALRNLARAVGANSLRNERGLAVIRLGGFSNWHQVEPFAWLSRDLLGNAVKIYVLLDRDYREDATIETLRDALKGSDVYVHVWHRKEIESYLLVPEAIARASGLEVA